MKIAIDANEANVTTPVGTGQYTRELLSHWHGLTSSAEFHLLLKHPPLAKLPSPHARFHYLRLSPAPAWTRIALPLHLLTHPPYSAFFSPAHYLPPITRAPSIVTIHDLAYEYFPKLFLPSDRYKLKSWTRRAVKQAVQIIAVSSSTKLDLIKLYQVPENKITVISNGYNSKLFNTTSKISTDILSRHQLQTGNYLLFLGTLQPRKNVIKLVQAFRLLKQAGYPGKLVLAGRIGWLAEETLTIIRRSPDHSDIILTGYVSESARQALYAHAACFIFPSLYEGFGVPILEAMASGCPVAAANNSSLPELVGNAGILFNPHDPAAIATAIHQLLASPTKWRQAGLTHTRHYSWKKCAAETLRVIIKASRL